MLIGSVATSLCAAGGFCAGSSVVVKHQVSSPLIPESLPFAHPLPAYQRNRFRFLRLHASRSRRRRFRIHLDPP